MEWLSRLEAIAAAVREGNWALRQHVDDNREKDPDRPTIDEIRQALMDDPENELMAEDSRHLYGPSCEIRATVNGRVMYVVCSYPPGPVWIITAYWPDTKPWKWADTDYRERSPS